MALADRKLGKLTAVAVAKVTKPGLLGDGGGLGLQISPSGGKSWSFRFMLRGKAREMGLGPYPTISLAAARQKAADCRRVVLEGQDPVEARKAELALAILEAARAVTFRDVAKGYIAAHEASWRNPKHRQQWSNTLQTYVYPVVGDAPVAEVTVADVIRVLEPIWAAKPETAARVRGRIEAILDYATARGWRTGENPARWRGHLQNLMPARRKMGRVKHHAAVPYTEMATFMAKLRSKETISGLGLEFLILTAARTAEVIGARWSEIDLPGAMWTVPAERMKAGAEHRVPLSAPALAVLERLQSRRLNDWVLPGGRQDKPLSNMAFLELLRGMDDYAGITSHGFRSSFRDWCGETTNYPREAAEAALAHTLTDKVEAAYRRGDLFEKRRRLMDDWGTFCGRVIQMGEVVPIRKMLLSA